MKFLLLAAACLSVAVAGPTRGTLFPESAGPIVIPGEEIATDPAIVPEEISVDPALVPEEISVDPALVPEEIAADPALVPEEISVGPALVEEAQQKSPFIQIIININSKNHAINIPVEDDSIPEIKPDPVDIIEEGINVGEPSLPLPPSPADIGTPELPGLDADNAQNIPDELN